MAGRVAEYRGENIDNGTWIEVNGKDGTISDALPVGIQRSLNLENPENTDSDGGRDVSQKFLGRQSGGERFTQAEIIASHDGSSDDTKSQLGLKVNNGTSLVDGIRIYSDQDVYIPGNVGIGYANPQSLLHLLSSTDPQLTISHTTGDDSLTIGVDANGDATLTPSGGDLTVDANLSVTGSASISDTLTTNGNYVVEGYSTGRSVLRTILLVMGPGNTPNTNINVNETSTNYGYNIPTVTDGASIAKSGSSGSFSLNSGGTIITMDIAENIVGLISVSVFYHDLNSSSTSEMYVPTCAISSNNLHISITKRGSQTYVDWTTILDAGDAYALLISFITSS